MTKSLDQKLAALASNPQADVFILADAKDADMAFGIGAPGRSPEYYGSSGEARFRTVPEWVELIRQIVHQQAVDIMLLSCYLADQLAREGLFENSPVTPAARANDTTDIWAVRHGTYIREPSRPFATATIDLIQCGLVNCPPDQRGEKANVNLGLYSMTFNNDLDHDHLSLERYKAFRLEAQQKQFRHFLEVFDPNAPRGFDPDAARRPEQIAQFVNDHICRTLAGVPQSARPVFLKIVYHGPAHLEELVRYDPSMVVGILGGSAGTTRDAFQLIHDARRHGAKVALFGRKINNAENQLAFIRFLRLIADGQIDPVEAVRAYHGVLQGLRITPRRTLDQDLLITDQAMSYGGTSTSAVVQGSRPAAGKPAPAAAATPSQPGAGPHAQAARGGKGTVGPTAPALASMSPEQRLAYHLARIRGKA